VRGLRDQPGPPRAGRGGVPAPDRPGRDGPLDEFTLSPTSGGTRLHLIHRDLPASQTELHGTGWDHFFSRLTVSVTGAGPGPDPWLMPANP